MEFINIDSSLKKYNLEYPDLKVLRRDENRYKLAAYQPLGEIITSENPPSVRHKEETRISVINKFYKYWSFVFDKEHDIEIALAPEYAMPWECLDKCLKDSVFPDIGNIWVSGCEGINALELNNFIDNNKEVIFLFDEDTCEKAKNNNKYLNCIVILFQTNDTSGDQKKVIAIEFKTQAMGGNTFEINYMQQGEKRIFFQKNQSTILIPLICAETLNLNIIDSLNKIDQDRPYIILHLLLNNKPADISLTEYRFDVYKKFPEAEKIQIYCLNWSKDTKVGDEVLCYGGSSFFIKSDKLITDDNRFSINDEKGLYYSYWNEARCHVYFLEYEEKIFLFKNDKPFYTSSVPVQCRTPIGPEVVNKFFWCGNDHKLCSIKHKSLFDYLNKYSKEDWSPLNGETLSSINKERLLALSTGNILNSIIDLRKNLHFQTIDGIKHNRVLLFEPQDDRRFKETVLSQFVTLKKICSGGNFPVNFLLNNELILNYSPNESNLCYYFNYKDRDNNPYCIVYIGDNNNEQAKAIFNTIYNLTKDSQIKIIIWYQFGGLSYFYDDTIPVFTDTKGNRKSFSKKAEK